MKTLEAIKDKYAQSEGFESWSYFMYWLKPEEIEPHMNKICILVQREQQKIITENAKMRGIDFDCDCGQTHTDWNIDKSSIINDKNIIR